MASRPEMRVQGVVVENFNKTDENDVFEKSVDSLIMRNQIYFWVMNLKKVNQVSQSQEGTQVQIENWTSRINL